jgi:hypothetical protein
MTKEQKQLLSKSERDQIYGLEILSQICYNSHLNIEFCRSVIKNVPASKLKDVAIYYSDNQSTWLSRMMRALKGCEIAGLDIYSTMKDDFDNMPLVALFDVLSNLKQVPDMESVAEIVEECVGIKDLTPVLVNIKALIRNEKNKQSGS